MNTSKKEKYVKLSAVERVIEGLAGGFDYIECGWKFAVGKIKEVPAADVAPVRHGRWELLTMSTDNGMEVIWVHAKCGCERYEKSNFCPNCGARMDGDGE